LVSITTKGNDMSVTLKDVGSGYKRTAINSNFEAIEAEINNNLLSKNGGVGLEADLDANSQKIINLANGLNSKDAVNLGQLQGAISGAGEGLIASQRELQTGADIVGSVSTFTGITYTVGGNNLFVFRNGNFQTVGIDYTETSSSSITWTTAPNSTDGLTFITNLSTTNNTTNTSAITHVENSTNYNLAPYLQNRHVVSVKDFGALGDGLNDDSVAIQNAVNAANGGIVLIPEGTYKINTTISIDTTGEGDTSVPSIIGFGMYNTVIDNQTGGEAFHVESGTGAEFTYGFTLERLRITCLAVSAGTIGVRVDGSRFVTLDNVMIDSQSSHGVYGLSSLGDFTDTSSFQLKQCQIESNGGYGIYASCTGGAIQYSWNADQCRIGSNALGGALLESGINLEFTNCGIYYNGGFGVRIIAPSGGAAPKLVDIYKCEFDTNDGVQIDIQDGSSVNIYEPYLIANAGTPTVFTKGIVVGANVRGCTITSSYPRLNPTLTGLVVHELEAGSTGIAIRDTNYQGYSALNGDMYVLNSVSYIIDDIGNRNGFFKGSYTAEIKNTGLITTSPTTVTANYRVNGDVVTVSFRGLDNIDVSGFAGGDILGVTLPFPALAGATSGYIGSCIITSDGGTGIPAPTTSNGSTLAAFQRSGSNAFLTASDLTTGVSDIANFTLTYFKAP
jgi:hypothetical protein